MSPIRSARVTYRSDGSLFVRCCYATFMVEIMASRPGSNLTAKQCDVPAKQLLSKQAVKVEFAPKGQSFAYWTGG
eukprot:3926787-Pleurochrysis_carterae.AAC.2